MHRCFILLLSAALSLVSNTHAAQPKLSQPIIRYDSIHRDIEGLNGMVVSQNALSTHVGHDILAKGGNAVDAAVAVGFALAVTLPRAGNLGGSGFMLVHLAEKNETIALDYRSIAPPSRPESKNRSESGDIRWEQLTFGANASGVPGTVAGLHHAWKKYGSLKWSELVEPAIVLAEQGITVWPDLSFALAQAKDVLGSYPSSSKTYLKPDKSVWLPGELFKQPDLAWSLKQIQSQGADAFYRGALAKRIVAAYAAHDNHFTLEDLASYKVTERAIVETMYRSHRVVSMPPSSAGGITLLQMLNMLEQFNVRELGAGTAKHLHLLSEVMKRAAANRRTHVGDPDFVDVKVIPYISKLVAKDMAKNINFINATDVKAVDPVDFEQYESRDTTHYSIVDQQGNAVSNTYTIGYSFGSGFVADGTGILFDNQLRNFYVSNGAAGLNAYQPGKRMISTMTPTMVFKPDGRLHLVTGTPGGSRIINAVLQVIVNMIDFDMSVADATNQPRIHQGWNSATLHYEPGISEDTLQILRTMGHKIRLQKSMASTQSIHLADDRYYGSADPRRPNALAKGVLKLN